MIYTLIAVTTATLFSLIATGMVGGLEQVSSHRWIEAVFWSLIIGGALVDLIAPIFRKRVCPLLAGHLGFCRH